MLRHRQRILFAVMDNVWISDDIYEYNQPIKNYSRGKACYFCPMYYRVQIIKSIGWDC